MPIAAIRPSLTVRIDRGSPALLVQAEKLKATRDLPADPGVSFEHTGIDCLIVDELHDFKKPRHPPPRSRTPASLA